MTKYTIQKRFYLFTALTLMYAYSWQFYFNHQQDKYINEAFEGHNKTYQRSIEINNELRAENTGLKHDLTHQQAMNHATQNHVKILQRQINSENKK
tara:strand:+ start:757 stop:1044 length:288 start_codon:yes stop_codon:yes gene_type:complete